MGSIGPFEWNGLPTVKWPPGRSHLVAVLDDSASKEARWRSISLCTRSILPFVCGWRILDRTCRMPRRFSSASNAASPRLRPSASFAKNCEPWSVIIEAGRPCLAMAACSTASALAVVASSKTPWPGR